VATAPRIGFIGLGMMGLGMARNLLDKGFALTAMAHHRREALEHLVANGAREAATARELAEASDMVILCVTGAPQVEAIVHGEEGLLAGCRPGMIVIDCTTSEPGTTLAIAAELAAKGAQLADAPLARTPVEAEAGRLNTMVGASGETFARIKPVLEAFCENIFHVGEVGAGHKCKLIYNFLAMGQAGLIAEALCACAATGVGLDKYAEVVSAGGANSGIFQLLVPKVLAEGDVSGLQFSLANAEKDIRYYTRMTGTVPLEGSLGKTVHNTLLQGLALGFTEGLVGSLIEAQAKLNGVEIIGQCVPLRA
jgi:3-hydroxyisobutyrate dehydrogenase-like beta-hydroxyacid dehydrogenase